MSQEKILIVEDDKGLNDGLTYDLREEGYEVFSVLSAARDLEQDEIRGFDCGADDYITKPFRMALLHKRIRAVLKRAGRSNEKNRYSDGRLTVDFDTANAVLDGKPLILTPTEYKLLKLFIDNQGKVLTRS